MEITLEQLGLSKEEITDRAVEECIRQLLRRTIADEDGEPIHIASEFTQEIEKRVSDRLDKAFDKLVSTTLLGNAEEYLRAFEFQPTDNYGREKGEKVGLMEYLVKRCDLYMTERVDYFGKDKSQGDYNWRGKQPRIVWVIDKIIESRLEGEIKRSITKIKETLGKGLSEMLQESLSAYVERIGKTFKL